MVDIKNLYFSSLVWRGARVAEEARLESVCASKAYRGFESLSLRESLLTVNHLIIET
jgi:hypothetical protein